jgi:inward rectifier potassium channel
MRNTPASPEIPRRLIRSDGSSGIVSLGQREARFSDAYHWLLNTSRLNFALVLIGLYLGVNLIFALAYLAVGDGIANARQGSFADAFFFSVQTMSTLGYGGMVPKSIAANLLVTVEAAIGMFGIAVAAGLLFARFTRPTAGVRFSTKMVVSNYDGVPMLMFRIANQRRDQINEARVHIVFMATETTTEGYVSRRLHDLELARAFTPVFGLTWTVRHAIDEKSPLYGLSPEEIAARDGEFSILFSGYHSGFFQDVHARKGYIASEICWGMKFVDIFLELPDGRRAIDFSRFDGVEPVEGAHKGEAEAEAEEDTGLCTLVPSESAAAEPG